MGYGFKEVFINLLALAFMIFAVYCVVSYVRSLGGGRKIRPDEVLKVLKPVVTTTEEIVDKVIDGGKGVIRTVKKRNKTTYETEYEFKARKNEEKKSKGYKKKLDYSRKEFIREDIRNSRRFRR